MTGWGRCGSDAAWLAPSVLAMRGRLVGFFFGTPRVTGTPDVWLLT